MDANVQHHYQSAFTPESTSLISLTSEAGWD